VISLGLLGIFGAGVVPSTRRLFFTVHLNCGLPAARGGDRVGDCCCNDLPAKRHRPSSGIHCGKYKKTEERLYGVIVYKLSELVTFILKIILGNSSTV
jgi:hypothetical protein